MVNIVAGEGLGLFNTTDSGLGKDTALEDQQNQISINASTGNLVIQRQDIMLMGMGKDTGLLRTYNSQGDLSDDNGDRHRFQFEQQLRELPATPNAPGSQITRVSADGFIQTFDFNSDQNIYVSQAGDGAHDEMRWDTEAGEWRYYQDGGQAYEAYGDIAGQQRLVRSMDALGNSNHYHYNDDGRVESIAAGEGQGIRLVYEPDSARVSEVIVTALNEQGEPTEQTRTRYYYNDNKLSVILIDLTPNDLTDNQLYFMGYEYDDQGRLNGIREGFPDGSANQLRLRYDDNNRVTRLTVGEGEQEQITQFNYDTPNTTHIDRVVDVTTGAVSRFTLLHDDQKRLIETTTPAPMPGVDALVTTYQYDQEGNVRSVQNSSGEGINYHYVNGNLNWQWDSVGSARSYAYNDNNQRLRDSQYLVENNTLTRITTHYLYDNQDRLRFVINAEGEVTEYRYDNNTQGDDPSSQRVYLADHFAVDSYIDDSPSLETLQSWASDSARHLTRLQREDTYYDVLGQVEKRVEYSQTNSAGEGVYDGDELVTHYSYDPYGYLISTIDGRGARTSYLRDALGQVTELRQNADSMFRSTTYSRVLGFEVTSKPRDLTQLSLFNDHGQLLQRFDSIAGTGAIFNVGFRESMVTYVYDDRGRQVAEFNADGSASVSFYDEVDRKIADIDRTGALTEYRYDENSQLIKRTAYHHRVNLTALLASHFAQATVANSPVMQLQTPLTVDDLDGLRQLSPSEDRTEHWVYDTAGSLRFAIDGEGYVTETQYNGLKQITQVIEHGVKPSGIDEINLLSLANAMADKELDLVVDNGYLDVVTWQPEGDIQVQVSSTRPAEQQGFDLVAGTWGYDDAMPSGYEGLSPSISLNAQWVENEVFASDLMSLEASNSLEDSTLLSNGNWVATWSTPANSEGELPRAFAQIYRPDGSRLGDIIAIGSADSTTSELTPQAMAIDNGGFIIVWTSGSLVARPPGYSAPWNAALTDALLPGSILAQRFSDSGEAMDIAPWPLTPPSHDASFPKIIRLADGQLLALWAQNETSQPSYSTIVGRLLDHTGNPISDSEPLQLMATMGDLNDGYERLQAYATPDGGFVLTWHDPQTNTLKTNRFIVEDGNFVAGNVFDLDIPWFAYSTELRAIALDEQKLLFVYFDKGVDTYRQVLKGKIVNLTASTVNHSDAFQISNRYIDIDSSSLGHDFDVGLLNDGTAVATWVNELGSVMLARYNSVGDRLGGPIAIANSASPSATSHLNIVNNKIKVTWEKEGGFQSRVVFWNDDSEIIDENYNALENIQSQLENLVSQGAETQLVQSTQVELIDSKAYLGKLTNGNQVIYRGSPHGDGANYLQILDPQGNILGEPAFVQEHSSFQNILAQPLRDGGFVLLWNIMDSQSSTQEVYARLYDDLGNKVSVEDMHLSANSDFLDGAAHKYLPKSTQLDDGRILVSWMSEATSSNYHNGEVDSIEAVILTAEGNLDEASQVLNLLSSVNLDEGRSLITLKNGSIGLLYEHHRADNDLRELYFQRIDASGLEPVNTPILIDSKSSTFFNRAYVPYHNKLLELPNGKIFVAWDGAVWDGGTQDVTGAVIDIQAGTAEKIFTRPSKHYSYDYLVFDDGSILVGIWRNEGEGWLEATRYTQQGQILDGPMDLGAMYSFQFEQQGVNQWRVYHKKSASSSQPLFFRDYQFNTQRTLTSGFSLLNVLPENLDELLLIDRVDVTLYDQNGVVVSGSPVTTVIDKEQQNLGSLSSAVRLSFESELNPGVYNINLTKYFNDGRPTEVIELHNYEIGEQAIPHKLVWPITTYDLNSGESVSARYRAKGSESYIPLGDVQRNGDQLEVSLPVGLPAAVYEYQIIYRDQQGRQQYLLGGSYEGSTPSSPSLTANTYTNQFGNQPTTHLQLNLSTWSTATIASWEYRPVDSTHYQAVAPEFVDTAGKVALVGLADGLYDYRVNIVDGADSYHLEGRFTVEPSSHENLQHTVALEDASRRTDYHYDLAGRLINTTGPRGEVVEYHYNAAGQQLLTTRLAEVDQPQNTQRDYSIYDGAGRKVAQVDAKGYVTSWRYNTAGKMAQQSRYNSPVDMPALLSTVGGDINQLSLNNVLPVADPANDQHAYFEYNAHGQEILSLDHNGQATLTYYDAAGFKQTSAICEGSYSDGKIMVNWSGPGRLQLFNHDSWGKLLHTTNDNTLRSSAPAENLRYNYDDRGRLSSQTDEQNQTVYFFYDQQDRQTYTINAAGELQHTYYNSFGEVEYRRSYIPTIDTAVLATLSDASESSLIAAFAALAPTPVDELSTEQRAQWTALSYQTFDRRGLVTATANNAFADDYARQQGLPNSRYTYNAFGEVKTLVEAIQDANQGGSATRSTYYRYDQGGLLTQTTVSGNNQRLHSANIVTEQDHDVFGRVTHSHDAMGNSNVYGYDRLGQLLTITDGENHITQTTYDAFGRVLTQTDANGQTTTYQYDDQNRRFTITQALNDGTLLLTSHVHNAFGELVEQQDPEGHKTVYQYDGNGNLTNTERYEWQADSESFERINEQEQAFDNSNRLIYRTDANGIHTVYSYDAANRIETVTLDPRIDPTDASGLTVNSDALNHTTQSHYDHSQQRLTHTDANGVVTATHYDAEGRVSRIIQDPSGLALLTVYQYDAQGLQVSEQRGAIIEGSDHFDSHIQYNYDTLGRRIAEIVDPGDNGLQLTTRYDYDNNNNVIKREDANGHLHYFAYNKRNEKTYSIDALGYVSQTNYQAGGQVEDQISYRASVAQQLNAWLVTNPDQQAPSQETINSWLAAQTEAEPVLRHSRFSYDNLGRLTSKTQDPLGEAIRSEFQYDGNGNLISQIDAAGTAAASTTRHLYDGANQKRFSVDPEGGVTEYRYDRQGQLLGSQRWANTVTLPELSISSLQQALGQVSIQVTSTAATVQDPAALPADITNGHWVFEQDASEASLVDTGTHLADYLHIDELPELDAPLGSQQLQTVSVRFEGLSRDGSPLPESVVTTLEPGASLRAINLTETGPLPEGHYSILITRHYSDGTETVDSTTLAGLEQGPQPRLNSQLSWQAHSDVATADRISVTLTDPAGTSHSYSLADSALSETSPGHYTLTLANTEQGQYQVSISYFDADTRLGQGDWQWLAQAGSQTDSLSFNNSRLQQQQLLDAAGNVRFTIDSQGLVREQHYNTAGQVTATVRYDRAIAPGPIADAVHLQQALNAVGATARLEQRFIYDAAGRLAYSSDEIGYIEAYQYTTQGTLSRKERYGALLSESISHPATVLTPADIATFLSDWWAEQEASLGTQGQVSPETLATLRQQRVQVEHYLYDTAGRERYRVDNAGFVFASHYNGLGALTQSIIYELPLSTEDQQHFSESVLLAHLASHSKQVQSVRNIYDGAGRLRYQIDQHGYATETQYDAAGLATGSKRYTVPIAVGAEPSVADVATALSQTALSLAGSLFEDQLLTLNPVQPYEAGDQTTNDQLVASNSTPVSATLTALDRLVDPQQIAAIEDFTYKGYVTESITTWVNKPTSPVWQSGPSVDTRLSMDSGNFDRHGVQTIVATTGQPFAINITANVVPGYSLLLSATELEALQYAQDNPGIYLPNGSAWIDGLTAQLYTWDDSYSFVSQITHDHYDFDNAYIRSSYNGETTDFSVLEPGTALTARTYGFMGSFFSDNVNISNNKLVEGRYRAKIQQEWGGIDFVTSETVAPWTTDFYTTDFSIGESANEAIIRFVADPNQWDFGPGWLLADGTEPTIDPSAVRLTLIDGAQNIPVSLAKYNSASKTYEFQISDSAYQINKSDYRYRIEFIDSRDNSTVIAKAMGDFNPLNGNISDLNFEVLYRGTQPEEVPDTQTIETDFTAQQMNHYIPAIDYSRVKSVSVSVDGGASVITPVETLVHAGTYTGQVWLTREGLLEPGRYAIALTVHYNDSSDAIGARFDYEVGPQHIKGSELVWDQADSYIASADDVITLSYFEQGAPETLQTVTVTAIDAHLQKVEGAVSGEGSGANIAVPAQYRVFFPDGTLAADTYYDFTLEVRDADGRITQQAQGQWLGLADDISMSWSPVEIATSTGTGTSLTGYLNASKAATLSKLTALVVNQHTGEVANVEGGGFLSVDPLNAQGGEYYGSLALASGQAVSTYIDPTELASGRFNGQLNLTIGNPLEDGQKYWVFVTEYDHFGNASIPRYFAYEMGLQNDYNADWVAVDISELGISPTANHALRVYYGPEGTPASDLKANSTNPEVATAHLTDDESLLIFKGVTAGRFAVAIQVVNTDNPADAIIQSIHGVLDVDDTSGPQLTLSGEGIGTLRHAQTEHSVYDSVGRLVYHIDALGYVQAQQYDGLGNTILTEHYSESLWDLPGSEALSQPFTVEAIDELLPSLSRDKNSITTLHYDGNGRRTALVNWREVPPSYGDIDLDTLTEAQAVVEHYHYDALGNRLKVENAKGHHSHFVYDATGRLVRERQPVDADQGVLIDYRYDAQGNRTAEVRYKEYVALNTDVATLAQTVQSGDLIPQQAELSLSFNYSNYSDAHVTLSRYDAQGQLVAQILAPGTAEQQLTEWGYDAFGNQVLQVEAPGTDQQRRIQRSFNAANQMIEEQVSAGGQTLTTRFSYDGFGQVASIIDPRGVELAESDSAWAVAERQRLSNQGIIDLGSRLYAADLTITDRIQLLARYTSDQRHDARGLKLAERDPLGNVTYTSYDAFGNITKATDPNGNTGYFYYDDDNRLMLQVDSQGFITRYHYDAQDRLVETRRYQQPINLDAIHEATGGATVSGVRLSLQAVEEHLRLQPLWSNSFVDHSVDGLGEVHDLDPMMGLGTISGTGNYEDFVNVENGRIALTYQDDTSTSGGPNGLDGVFGVKRLDTHQQDADISYRAEVSVADDKHYLAVFIDNEQSFSSGNMRRHGVVLHNGLAYYYDQNGKRATPIQNADGQDLALEANTRYIVEITTDASGSSVFFYQAEDEQESFFSRDSLQANDWGDIRFKAWTLGEDDVTIPGIAYLHNMSESPTAQLNRFTYDELGRQTESFDGLNTESVSYDALGHKVSETNKNGYTTYFEVGDQGRLQREISPPVDVAINTDTTPSILKGVRLVKDYQYDAQGNRTQEILQRTGASAAANLNGASLTTLRVTEYQYDQLGRQTAVILDKDGLHLQTGKTYDARGNVLVTEDAKGLRSYFYYDGADRVVASVDAGGTLRENDYDAVGNVIAERVYDHVISDIDDQWNGETRPVVRGQSNREITHAYNANNQRLWTQTERAWFFSYAPHDTNNSLSHQQAIQYNAYDGNGNLIAERDANGNLEVHYYDRFGNPLLSVDAAGYVIERQHNAQGDVVREVRYAGQLSRTTQAALRNSIEQRQVDASLAANYERPIDSSDLPSIDDVLSEIQFVSPEGENRLTEYTYDQLGRLVEERLRDVRYTDFVSDTLTEGDLASGRGDRVTYYYYDGLGQVVAEVHEGQESNDDHRVIGESQRSDFRYDTLGRLVLEQGTAIAGVSGDVRPTTSLIYDAYGNEAFRNQEAHGEELFDRSAADHSVRRHYDAAGRVTKEWDAKGHLVSFSHDKNGNTTGRSEVLSDFAGVAYTKTLSYTYDALNRQVAQTTHDVSGQNIVEALRYNQHGEIISKGTYALAPGQIAKVTDAAYQGELYYQYDNLGRLFKTNENNGTPRVYLYDANGNATMEITSQTTNLEPLGLEEILYLNTGTSLSETDRLLPVITRYDQRNQKVEVLEPNMAYQNREEGIDVSGSDIPQPPFEPDSVTVDGGGEFGLDIGLWARPYRKKEKASGVEFHQTHVDFTWDNMGDYVGQKFRIEWDTGFGEKILRPIYDYSNLRQFWGYSFPTIIKYDVIGSESQGNFEFTLDQAASSLRIDDRSIAQSGTYTHNLKNRSFQYNFTLFHDKTGNGDWEIFTQVNQGEGASYGWDRHVPARNQGRETVISRQHYKPTTLLIHDQPLEADHVMFFYDDNRHTRSTFLDPQYRYDGHYSLAETSGWSQARATRVDETTWAVNLSALGLSEQVDYEYFYRVSDLETSSLLNRAEGMFTWDGETTLDGTDDKTVLDSDGQSIHFHHATARPRQTSSSLGYLIDDMAGLVEHAVNRRLAYNAFGEVSEEVDGRDHRTVYYYNRAGDLIRKQDPETNITLDTGRIERRAPATDYHYDLLGRIVGQTDANGHTSAQRWQGDQVVREFMATGYASLQGSAGMLNKNFYTPSDGWAQSVTRAYAYDEFKQKRQVTDERGHQHVYTYDKNDNLSIVDRAGKNDDLYLYDALGQRITHQRIHVGGGVGSSNSLHSQEQYRFDRLGRVIEHIGLHTGGTISSGDYHYANFVDNGVVTQYQYNYQSAAVAAGGVAGWRKSTINAENDTLIDEVDRFDRQRFHKDMGGREHLYTYNNAGWLSRQYEHNNADGQDIYYGYYDNGYLRGISDRGVNSSAEFQYDENGNLTYEGYYAEDHLDSNKKNYQQSSHVEYDEHNRMVAVHDQLYTLAYEYDAVGNRRRVTSRFNYDEKAGEIFQHRQDYWYAYDQLNRFTITQGSIQGSMSDRSEANGVITAGAQGYQIAYTADNQRDWVTHRGVTEDYSFNTDGFLEETWINGVRRAKREVDSHGFVTRYQEFDTANDLTRDEHKAYLGDGRQYLMDEAVGDEQVSWSYDRSGLLQNTHVQRTNGDVLETDYEYERWDSYKQKTIKISGTAIGSLDSEWRPGFSEFTYDANGNLSIAVDRERGRDFHYTNNYKGQVMRRLEYTRDSTQSLEHRHYYFYINGIGVGDVNDSGETNYEDYAALLARSQERAKNGNDIMPVFSADFDANFIPVGPNYPAQTPGSYVVQSNHETLQSVAQTVWGDSSLWYLIADANALGANADLKADMELVIPNRITNIHNNDNTYRPYDPGVTLGDTSPTLPDVPPPPAPKGGGCGLKQIVMVIIVVVVAFYLGPLVFGYLGGGVAAGLTLPNVLAAAGAAMAVNAVTQVAGMALGLQDGFDWRAMAESGVVGAATFGIGVGLGQLAKGSGTMASLSQMATQTDVGAAVVKNVISQSVSMAMGGQKKFDWRGVAVAVASSTVNGLVHGFSEGNDNLMLSQYRKLDPGSLSNGSEFMRQFADMGKLGKHVASAAFNETIASAVYKRDFSFRAVAQSSFESHFGDALMTTHDERRRMVAQSRTEAEVDAQEAFIFGHNGVLGEDVARVADKIGLFEGAVYGNMPTSVERVAVADDLDLRLNYSLDAGYGAFDVDFSESDAVLAGLSFDMLVGGGQNSQGHMDRIVSRLGQRFDQTKQNLTYAFNHKAETLLGAVGALGNSAEDVFNKLNAVSLGLTHGMVGSSERALHGFYSELQAQAEVRQGFVNFGNAALEGDELYFDNLIADTIYNSLGLVGGGLVGVGARSAFRAGVKGGVPDKFDREYVLSNIESSRLARESSGFSSGGYIPGPGERALTKDQYKSLMSQYRNQGPELQAALEFNLSQTDYVYRATNYRTLGYYQDAGRINRPAYTTTDYVGLDPKVIMDRSQVFEHWGEPEVLVKIPVSELVNPTVPRPLGGSMSVGWEPVTDFYPAAGKGGINQFLTETKSWDDSWVIPLKN